MDHKPKCKTMKLLDDSMGKTDDLGYDNDFLDTTPKVHGPAASAPSESKSQV